MADITLTFYVYLTDRAQYDSLKSQFPFGWPHGPIPAATELGIPYLTRDQPLTPPCVQTAWHPKESSGKFLYDRTVFRISKGGWFGKAVGANDRFVWNGQFRYVGPPIGPTEGSTAVDAGPVENAPMPGRKWLLGFEVKDGSANSAELGNGGGHASRDASRVLDGFGSAYRSNTGTDSFTANTNELTGTQNSASWERLYLRPRRLPTGVDVTFWSIKYSSEGLKLKLTAGGQIAVYTNTVTVDALSGVSSPITLNQWTKLDCVFEFYLVGADTWITYRLFVNGQQSVTGSGRIHTGGSTAMTHNSSQIGTDTASCEYDVDDWVCCELPDRFKRSTVAWASGTNYAIGAYATNVHGGKTKVYRATAASGPGNGGAVAPPNAAKWVQSIGPVDFFAGSHIRAAKPASFGPAHQAANWTQLTIPYMERIVDAGSVSGFSGVSTVSGSIVQVVMDAKNLGLGAAAMTVAARAGSSGLDGSIGVTFPDATTLGPTVLTAMIAGVQWTPQLYSPTGNAPKRVDPLTVTFTKGADAVATTLDTLSAAIEYIGVFDACDVSVDPTDPAPPAAITVPRFPGLHNAPFPRSPWASADGAPFAPVIAKAGTYVGSGTTQDLTLGVPPHFLWIRATTLNNGGNRWWSTMFQAAHKGLDRSAANEGVQIIEEDPTYTSPGGATDPEERYRVRLTGNQAESNQSGVTYQYLLLSDPSERFLLNGSLTHGDDALDDGAIDIYADPSFLPDFALLWVESIISPDSTTAGFYGKGPGHAASEGSVLNATSTASLVNLATAGQMQTFTALNGLGQQTAYALMRTAEPGAAAPSFVFQTRAYVGNGAAGTRDIALTPASGKRPLFALVIPDNAASYFRDPSFSGGNSQTVAGGAPVTTGITAAGVDFITVGTTLNANAVDYSVLVICGGTVASNDGWSANGEFLLAEPDMPTGAQWTAPLASAAIDLLENPPAAVDVGLPGEPDLDVTTALPGTTEHCEFYSRRLVNVALSRIGVSKQIANLNTDQTEEATLARLHLKVDIDATLRDFPWPFATRYVDLTLVAGTAAVPATKDWQYAYRAPSAMVAARRVVGQADQRRGYDPRPPTFRVGSDAGGTLVYSDAAIATATPVVLEYTTRMSCPAYQGDPLFQDALAWRLAASLAPALSKDAQKQRFCLLMYRDTLNTAETAAANETQQPRPDPDAEWISGRN